MKYTSIVHDIKRPPQLHESEIFHARAPFQRLGPCCGRVLCGSEFAVQNLRLSVHCSGARFSFELSPAFRWVVLATG